MGDGVSGSAGWGGVRVWDTGRIRGRWSDWDVAQKLVGEGHMKTWLLAAEGGLAGGIAIMPSPLG